jgi:transcriptional regulator with XRE-family HTH domain
MAIAARFAANVVGYRQALGISQEELGVRASVHRTEVSQIERGLRLPRIDTLAKLCGSPGVEPNALMAGIGWRPGEIRAGSFHQTRATREDDDSSDPTRPEPADKQSKQPPEYGQCL